MTSNISGYNQVVNNFQSTLKLEKGEDVAKYMHSKNSGLSDWLFVLARRVGHLFTSGVWINEARILKEVGDLKAMKEPGSLVTKIKEIKAVNDLFKGKSIRRKLSEKTLVKINSSEVSTVCAAIKEKEDNLGKLSLNFKLDDKIGVFFNYNNVNFKLKLSDEDMSKLTQLEQACGQKVSKESNVSKKIGIAFFDWACSQDFAKDEKKIKNEYTLRAGMFVKDIQALMINKGLGLPSKVRISGAYSKYINPLTFTTMPKFLRSEIIIKSDLGFTLSLKAGDKEKDSLNAFLSDIVGHKYKLKHLSAVTGQNVTTDSDFNDLMGPLYWKWTAENWKWSLKKIIEGHKARIVALALDLKELGASVKIKNQVDYNDPSLGSFVSPISLLKNTGYDEKNLFKAPLGGIFNSNYYEALNCNQDSVQTKESIQKKGDSKEWFQMEANYNAFFERLKKGENNEEHQYKIPKEVHCIWIGNKPPSEDTLKVKESWEKHHPGWKVKLWQNDEAEALIKEMREIFPKVGETWDKAVKFAEKADVLRYCILWKFGGVYSDTDLPCYGKVDDIHCYSDFYASIEQNDHAVIYVGNALIGSKAKHPIIEDCLNNLKPRKEGEDNWAIIGRTGPGLLTDAVYKGLNKDIKDKTNDTLIFPPSYFYSLPSGMSPHAGNNKNFAPATVRPWTKGLHLWNLSWA